MFKFNYKISFSVFRVGKKDSYLNRYFPLNHVYDDFLLLLREQSHSFRSWFNGCDCGCFHNF